MIHELRFALAVAMTSKVVNIRTSPYDVYIGRPGKGQPGPWGNPVVAGRPCPVCDDVHEGNGSTLACYSFYLHRRAREDAAFRVALQGLRGKTLGCFCPGPGGLTSAHKPFKCHGQEILRYLEENPE